MNNTYQILLNWDKGQPFAERMSAKILQVDKYEDIDPQCPTGGPDGTKDIICYKDSLVYLAACYYPNGQKSFTEIKTKFEGDFLGVSKNSAEGFVFITNQKITPAERIELCQNRNGCQVEIYHGERVCNILDGPKGYGIRLEYLGIELNKAEQISFLNNYVDLNENFQRLETMIESLNRVTTKLAGEVYSRDLSSSPLSVLPISGIKFSSRLSIEDILFLHRVTLSTSQNHHSINDWGFRKLSVWIGTPGVEKVNADFIPAPPEDVPTLMYELLKWWREEYMKVLHGSNNVKIACIAAFHEKFLTIHPFLDGNGRVARTLASIQFKDLLGRDVAFESIDRLDYYNALQKSRCGNIQELNDIFTALICE